MVHLGERDCSIQRRHQKLHRGGPVVTGADPRAAGSHGCGGRPGGSRRSTTSGAGTVEFLLRPRTGEFYFMEMNTRIQVEHPVTEVTTGFDLVKEQIRVAAGEPLSFPMTADRRAAPRSRDRVPDQRGGPGPHDFATVPGTITTFHPPGGPGVRTRHARVRGVFGCPRSTILSSPSSSCGGDDPRRGVSIRARHCLDSVHRSRAFHTTIDVPGRRGLARRRGVRTCR